MALIGGGDWLRTAAGMLSALMLCVGPVQAAEPVPGQLSAEKLIEFERPGTVWCFEPKGHSCSFITLSTEPVKFNPRYDVLELWDTRTVLTSHTGGVLRRDGRICEKGTAFIDTAEITSRFGVPLSEARHAEVRDQLRQIWQDIADVEYCYAYAVDRGGGADHYIQYQFADGEEDGDPLPLVIDSSPDATSKYRLRMAQ